MFIHKSENWQYFSRLLSLHLSLCFDHVLLYPEWGTMTVIVSLYNQDKFEFSEGQYMTKNQSTAVPVYLSESLGM